jgi:hypothetical protein
LPRTARLESPFQGELSPSYCKKNEMISLALSV